MLQKQNIDIPFSQGLDTKTDPYRVPVGKFLALKNTVFGINGQLTKRYGFGELAALPTSSSTFLTTFSGDLTAIGTELYAFNPGANTWVNKGSINPCQLSTLALVRNNYNQTQGDAAVAQNGLVCTTYTQTDGSTSTYYYVVADSVSGQNIVAPTAIVPSSGAVSGSPRVFVLGNFFVIVFTTTISAADHLQFVAINIYTLAVSAAADIVTAYDSASTVAWDGVVSNNSLYVAWNGASAAGIKMTYIDSTLTQHNTVTVDASHVGTLFSICADNTQSTPVIYVSYWASGTTNGYVLAVNQQLDSILAATAIITGVAVLNLTSQAQNGAATLFYEVSNAYTYDSNVKTNYISYRTCTQGGSLGSATVLKRSVGLASKAFIIDGVIYLTGVYSSSYQPTYFLLNAAGKILSSFAYQNGGGYLTLGLPGVSVSDSTASFLYRFKDLIEAANKNTNVPAGSQTAGIYSQTGLNLVSFVIGTEKMVSVEIANNLHLTGGFVCAYDGFSPVEQGFFLYPDSVELNGVITSGSLTAQQYFYQVTYEWTDNQGNAYRSAPSIPVSYTITAAPVSFTGKRTSGSAIITDVSSLTGLQKGQHVTGTGIPANTYILSIDTATQITLSANATSGTATDTTFSPTTLGSLKVSIPTLRLTYKTANPVKLVVYRWATDQPVYYQVTSISAPLINNPVVDYLEFTDSASNATILGNNIIYTTGGVLENVAPPPSSAMTIWDTRVWTLDAQNSDVAWFSKPVVQSAPVEFSDFQTVYVSPTKGISGPAGKLRCVFPMDDKLILTKNTALYYINGVGPDITGANNQYSEPTLITSTVGSNNQNSFVTTPFGIMFESVGKGIWLLGRDLKTTYIGAEVQAFNGSPVKSALTIPGTNQVRFTLENGITLMYDYFYGQWGTFYNIPGISSAIYEDLHCYLDQYGKVFQETPQRYLDGTNPVLMSFQTAWINLAGLQGYQRAYMFYLMGTFLSPHNISLGIAYDYASSASQNVLIQPQNYTGTWGSDSTWGSQSPWGGPAALEQWKINLQRQKCQAFQITFNEIFNPVFGTEAGAGLTLSGINCVVGIKKGYKPQRASTTAG